MELKTLRYFLTVAREGSIARAANSLFVTQPALSRQLKNLEDELGTKLYLRRSRGIELTRQGLLLKKRAEEILELADKAAAECRAADGEVSGDVFIGVGESYTSQFLARVAHTIARLHPRIRFHYYDGNEEDLTDRLDRGLLDLCILIHPANLVKYNCLRIPEKDVWGLLTHKNSELARKDAIRLDDLVGEPLVLSRQVFNDQVTQNDFGNWFGDEFENLNVVGTYNLAFNATLLAAEGVASVVALDRQVRVNEADILRFIPFDPPLEVKSDVVWKKHKEFSPAAEAFLEEVKRHLGHAG